jgi:eukaryotic-like serine/threonine-protein kinase
MGEVYRARDPRLDRDVAIKVLSESLLQQEQTLLAFSAGGKSMGASLSHPNILTV